MDFGERESQNVFRWTEELEDLLDQGDIDGGVSLLQSTISSIEALDQSSSSNQFSLALASNDLSKLYYSQGLTTEAEDLRSRSRSLLISARTHLLPVIDCDTNKKQEDSIEENVSIRVSSNLSDVDSVRGGIADHAEITPQVGNSRTLEDEDRQGKDTDALCSEKNEQEFDWEDIAERLELLEVVGISNIEKQEKEEGQEKPKYSESPKRRGRGSFFYNTNELYSDTIDSETSMAHSNCDDEGLDWRDYTREDDDKSVTSSFGTRHILVMYDFPSSTGIADLERLLEKYKETGIAIRWVNDTCALAVFRTPTLADEAKNHIPFPFKVRYLEVDDSLLNRISSADLQPPHPRPKTSARTANQLISRITGMHLPSDFGFNERKKQEEARKNRIRTRQRMRDDAWGPDDQ